MPLSMPCGAALVDCFGLGPGSSLLVYGLLALGCLSVSRCSRVSTGSGSIGSASMRFLLPGACPLGLRLSGLPLLGLYTSAASLPLRPSASLRPGPPLLCVWVSRFSGGLAHVAVVCFGRLRLLSLAVVGSDAPWVSAVSCPSGCVVSCPLRALRFRCRPSALPCWSRWLMSFPPCG